MKTSTSQIRDPALLAAVDDAALRKVFDPLMRLLRRHSGLPGPRPNLPVATAVAARIAEHGETANALVADLCNTDDRVRPGGPDDFFPICGAMAHAARFRLGIAPDRALDALRQLAEDRRHLVRGGVIAALRQMACDKDDQADRVVRALAAWMDGYLPAAVAIETIAHRSVLDRIHAAEADTVMRLEEGFFLAENAPRADERSQGYRELVGALSNAPVAIMSRFGDRTAAWLEGRAKTKVPELRRAIEAVSAKARDAGHGSARVAEIEAALSASAPERRDPLTYVGTTRQRGRKHGRGPKRKQGRSGP